MDSLIKQCDRCQSLFEPSVPQLAHLMCIPKRCPTCAGKSKQVLRQCVCCGKEYWGGKNAGEKRGRYKYCSVECQQQSLASQQRARQQAAANACYISKPCVDCGDVFVGPPGYMTCKKCRQIRKEQLGTKQSCMDCGRDTISVSVPARCKPCRVVYSKRRARESRSRIPTRAGNARPETGELGELLFDAIAVANGFSVAKPLCGTQKNWDRVLIGYRPSPLLVQIKATAMIECNTNHVFANYIRGVGVVDLLACVDVNLAEAWIFQYPNENRERWRLQIDDAECVLRLRR